MTYIRKTKDEYQLHINYGQGWEHETTEESWSALKEQQKCYRDNCPEYPTRKVVKRVRIEG